uniref:Uncharacterized protein n=1 Tax=Tetranychus urticae TaxID=32264 RepID=T1L0T4_TETUR
MDPPSKTSQGNPIRNPIGPGHNWPHTGYQGTGTKTDLDNHGKQMNPNNPAYSSSRAGTAYIY